MHAYNYTCIQVATQHMQHYRILMADGFACLDASSPHNTATNATTPAAAPRNSNIFNLDRVEPVISNELVHTSIFKF